MTHLRTFGKFWYDFIVGDDWRDAAAAVIAIALSFVAAHHGLNWWWLLPLTVTALLTISVRRATQPEVGEAVGDDEV
jgi:apolipoprotein N-acyltransferase